MCKRLLQSAAPIMLVLFLFCSLSAQPGSKQRKENTEPADYALLEACAKRDVSAAKKALDDGAYIDTQTISGLTPLMFAASGGDPALVKLLLANKADPNLKTNKGETALMFAEKQNRTEIVAILTAGDYSKVLKIAEGAAAKTTTSPQASATARPTPTPAVKPTGTSAAPKHNKPEDIAAMFKALTEWQNDTSMNTVRLINLLRGGVNPDARDKSGLTPLIYAAGLKEPYAALSWLIKSGADIDAQTTGEGTTALMEAVTRKNAFSVIHLAGAGARTDIKDKNGRTAYDIAVEVNDPLVLTLSDMLKPPGTGGQIIAQSAPAIASKHNKPEQISALFKLIIYRKNEGNRGTAGFELLSDFLKLGVNPDARDRFGLTPLIHAAAYDDDDAIFHLINAGADVNAQNPDGMTALMGAALKDKWKSVKALLLTKGIRKDLKDKKGRTAFDIAVEVNGMTLRLAGSDLKP